MGKTAAGMRGAIDVSEESEKRFELFRQYWPSHRCRKIMLCDVVLEVEDAND